MLPYITESIRRQDRVLSEEEAFRLLNEGEYGILSLSDGKEVYGIPLNYVWDGGDIIYFHCAPEGKKLTWIAEGINASFCIVGKTQVLPAQFSTGYESVILSGKVKPVTDDPERMKALELIVDKYSPDHKEVGRKYAAASFHRTAILAFKVKEMTGKTKPIPHK